MFCPVLYFLSEPLKPKKGKYVLLSIDKSFVNLKKGSYIDMRALATMEDAVKMN